MAVDQLDRGFSGRKEARGAAAAKPQISRGIGGLTGGSVRTERVLVWWWCVEWSRGTILSTRAHSSVSITCRCREEAAAGNKKPDTLDLVLAHKCKQVSMQRRGVGSHCGRTARSVGWEEAGRRRRTGRRVCIKFLTCPQSPQSTDGVPLAHSGSPQAHPELLS